MNKKVCFTTLLFPFVFIMTGIFLIIPGYSGQKYYNNLPWTSAIVTETDMKTSTEAGYGNSYIVYGDFEYEGKKYEHILLSQDSGHVENGDIFYVKINPEHKDNSDLIYSSDWYIAIIFGAISALIGLGGFAFFSTTFYEADVTTDNENKNNISLPIKILFLFLMIFLLPFASFLFLFGGIFINMLFYSPLVFCIYSEIVLLEFLLTNGFEQRRKYLIRKRAKKKLRI